MMDKAVVNLFKAVIHTDRLNAKFLTDAAELCEHGDEETRAILAGMMREQAALAIASADRLTAVMREHTE